MSSTQPQVPASPDASPPRGGPWRIGFISTALLILELSFIRLVPAEVRAISYFTNLMLMAAFFGLGLGCILSRKRSLAWLLPLGVLLVFAFTYYARGIIIHEEAQEVHYWLQYSNVDGQPPRIPLFIAALLAFGFSLLPFVALGQALAREMDRFEKLRAYGWDIGGSLLGTIVFSASAAFGVPPWVWPVLVMVAWAVFLRRGLPSRLTFAAAGLGFLLFAQSPHPSRWSPYYYVQWAQEAMGIRVWVNSTFLQLGLDFTTEDPELQRLYERTVDKWSIPYEEYRKLSGGKSPQRVLVMGAGTGNDVNVALRNGARKVVAVEIDPEVLSLGHEFNPTGPYADPRVTAVVDDARHYMHTTDERFDLVIFGTIDSVILVGGQANLRLENYVHTAEALHDAKELLEGRGLVGMYYSVFADWYRPRVYATLREAFGDQTRIFVEPPSFLFDTILVGAVGMGPYADTPASLQQYGGGKPSSDDWPFMYLQTPTIAPVYVKLMAFVLTCIAGAFIVLRRVHPEARGLNVNFLLLGLGFTLMESSAIVRFALLFGGTWTVNAVVFGAFLLTVFLANWAVLKQRAPALRPAFFVLLGGILVNAVFPLPWLFGLSVPLRIAVCTLLVGVPVFCASVCFSRLFARQTFTGYALGINLVGAMAGGIVEYLSMLVGMRAIWGAVLLVYALAWLATEWIGKRETSE